ncbi:hypothetical protein Tco_0438973 [Tanacetum coccineum]
MGREEDVSKTCPQNSRWTLTRIPKSYRRLVNQRYPAVLKWDLMKPTSILNAQQEARKPENIKNEMLGGIADMKMLNIQRQLRTEKLEPRTDGTLMPQLAGSWLPYDMADLRT